MARKKSIDNRKGKGNKLVKQVQAIVPVELPPAPSYFGLSARTMWDFLWRVGRDHYSVTDISLMERFCANHERRLNLIDELDAEGWSILGSKDQKVLNPLARVLLSIEERIAKDEEKLFLTPQARAEWNAFQEGDEVDSFFEGDDVD